MVFDIVKKRTIYLFLYITKSNEYVQLYNIIQIVILAYQWDSKYFKHMTSVQRRIFLFVIQIYSDVK